MEEGLHGGHLIDEVLVLLLVFVGFLVGPDFLDQNYVQDFAELVLDQLVVHDVQDFGGQAAVFPVGVSLPVQAVWVHVLLDYFLHNCNLVLPENPAQLPHVQQILDFNRKVNLLDELLSVGSKKVL